MTSDDLKAWRKQLGLTQTQAGQSIGVTLRAWQAWEAGDTDVPLASVIALKAIAYVRGQQPTWSTTKETAVFIEEIRELSEAARAHD